MTIFLRPVRREEYQIVADIRRSLGSRRESTVEGLLTEDDTWPANALLCRFLVEEEGRIVGEASCVETFWTESPDTVLFEFHLLTEQSGAESVTAIQTTVEEVVARERPRCPQIGTRIPEDRSEWLSSLQEEGFRIIQRDRFSRLDLRTFDGTPYHALQKKIADAGVEILTLSTFKELNSEWKRALRDLRWRIHQDVPLAEAVRKPSMAEFQEMVLDDPALEDEAWVLARIKSGELIGISNLWVNDPERRLLHTGLTGVLPAYRRLGIATALKLVTIEYGQRINAHWIETHNEENNPMVRINERLGFKALPARLHLRRDRQ